MAEPSMQLEDWLDDLCVRFIMNLPTDDLTGVERICFQVEEAQWYYEDFIRPLDPSLPSMSLRRFCERIFLHCPLLQGFTGGRHMQAFEQFLVYKQRIPVRGAIMLNEEMDSAVLVKGWKKGANWSFPRGKINKDEDDLICAIREVYEETGFDLESAGLVPKDRNVKYIEVNMREQQMRLYVFRDIPMDTHFEPRTRKEISKIEWWRLSKLPAFRKKGAKEQAEPGENANKFYMVAPFLVPLRKWVLLQKKQDSKRTVSNQYLSAGDELYTEEDRGAESTGGEPSWENPSHGRVPDSDALEGATNALRRLLQPQSSFGGEEEASSNTGSALLALLHSKPILNNPQTSQNAPPHTPQDHTMQQASFPTTPHHQQPRPPHSSSMPPPPDFPIQVPVNSFSYQQPELHNDRYSNNFQPSRGLVQPQDFTQSRNAHPYQPQHLIHPQPLPPNVQRAVFTGGAVHSPMVPRPVQEYSAPHFTSPISVAIHNPQFPGLHAPMVPAVPEQTQTKLTSHSLALLNAFKSRDQAVGDTSVTNEQPLRQYTDKPQSHQAPPQELPAEASQPVSGGLQPRPYQNADAPQGLSPGIFSASKPVSEQHKSTLLGLFKSPTTQSAVPAKPNILSIPSAVELSAVEPLSTNAASTSALFNNKRTPDTTTKTGILPRMNPEANLPFRAMTILSRPSESSDQERPTQTGPGMTTRSQPKDKSLVKNKTGKETAPIPQEQFQPQILKRVQPGILNTEELATPAQPLPPSLPSLLDPRTSNPASTDHKQTLLSLFGKNTTSPKPPSRKPTSDVFSPLNQIDSTIDISARSRVGSLASGDAASRRGSNTPISPADGFLLNYLENVAKGSQR